MFPSVVEPAREVNVYDVATEDEERARTLQNYGCKEAKAVAQVLHDNAALGVSVGDELPLIREGEQEEWNKTTAEEKYVEAIEKTEGVRKGYSGIGDSVPEYRNIGVPPVRAIVGALRQELRPSLNDGLWRRPSDYISADLTQNLRETAPTGGFRFQDQMFGFQPADRYVHEIVKSKEYLETKVLMLRPVEVEAKRDDSGVYKAKITRFPDRKWWSIISAGLPDTPISSVSLDWASFEACKTGAAITDRIGGTPDTRGNLDDPRSEAVQANYTWQRTWTVEIPPNKTENRVGAIFVGVTTADTAADAEGEGVAIDLGGNMLTGSSPLNMCNHTPAIPPNLTYEADLKTWNAEIASLKEDFENDPDNAAAKEEYEKKLRNAPGRYNIGASAYIENLRTDVGLMKVGAQESMFPKEQMASVAEDRDFRRFVEMKLRKGCVGFKVPEKCAYKNPRIRVTVNFVQQQPPGGEPILNPVMILEVNPAPDKPPPKVPFLEDEIDFRDTLRKEENKYLEGCADNEFARSAVYFVPLKTVKLGGPVRVSTGLKMKMWEDDDLSDFLSAERLSKVYRLLVVTHDPGDRVAMIPTAPMKFGGLWGANVNGDGNYEHKVESDPNKHGTRSYKTRGFQSAPSPLDRTVVKGKREEIDVQIGVRQVEIEPPKEEVIFVRSMESTLRKRKEMFKADKELFAWFESLFVPTKKDIEGFADDEDFKSEFAKINSAPVVKISDPLLRKEERIKQVDWRHNMAVYLESWFDETFDKCQNLVAECKKKYDPEKYAAFLNLWNVFEAYRSNATSITITKKISSGNEEVKLYKKKNWQFGDLAMDFNAFKNELGSKPLNPDDTLNKQVLERNIVQIGPKDDDFRKRYWMFNTVIGGVEQSARVELLSFLELRQRAQSAFDNLSRIMTPWSLPQVGEPAVKDWRFPVQPPPRFLARFAYVLDRDRPVLQCADGKKSVQITAPQGCEAMWLSDLIKKPFRTEYNAENDTYEDFPPEVQAYLEDRFKPATGPLRKFPDSYPKPNYTAEQKKNPKRKDINADPGPEGFFFTLLEQQLVETEDAKRGAPDCLVCVHPYRPSPIFATLKIPAKNFYKAEPAKLLKHWPRKDAPEGNAAWLSLNDQERAWLDSMRKQERRAASEEKKKYVVNIFKFRGRAPDSFKNREKYRAQQAQAQADVQEATRRLQQENSKAAQERLAELSKELAEAERMRQQFDREFDDDFKKDVYPEFEELLRDWAQLKLIQDSVRTFNEERLEISMEKDRWARYEKLFHKDERDYGPEEPAYERQIRLGADIAFYSREAKESSELSNLLQDSSIAVFNKYQLGAGLLQGSPWDSEFDGQSRERWWSVLLPRDDDVLLKLEELRVGGTEVPERVKFVLNEVLSANAKKKAELAELTKSDALREREAKNNAERAAYKIKNAERAEAAAAFDWTEGAAVGDFTKPLLRNEATAFFLLKKAWEAEQSGDKFQLKVKAGFFNWKDLVGQQYVLNPQFREDLKQFALMVSTKTQEEIKEKLKLVQQPEFAFLTAKEPKLRQKEAETYLLPALASSWWEQEVWPLRIDRDLRRDNIEAFVRELEKRKGEELKRQEQQKQYEKDANFKFRDKLSDKLKEQSDRAFNARQRRFAAASKRAPPRAAGNPQRESSGQSSASGIPCGVLRKGEWRVLATDTNGACFFHSIVRQKYPEEVWEGIDGGTVKDLRDAGVFWLRKKLEPFRREWLDNTQLQGQALKDAKKVALAAASEEECADHARWLLFATEEDIAAWQDLWLEDEDKRPAISQLRASLFDSSPDYSSKDMEEMQNKCWDMNEKRGTQVAWDENMPAEDLQEIYVNSAKNYSWWVAEPEIVALCWVMQASVCSYIRNAVYSNTGTDYAPRRPNYKVLYSTGLDKFYVCYTGLHYEGLKRESGGPAVEEFDIEVVEKMVSEEFGGLSDAFERAFKAAEAAYERQRMSLFAVEKDPQSVALQTAWDQDRTAYSKADAALDQILAQM